MLTMDHVNANSLVHTGLAGDKELLVVSHLAIGYLGAYPVGSKTSERVLMTLTHFLGHDRPREFYTDRPPELIADVEDG